MRLLSSSDPTRIGKYVITGRLGAGGMGQVFLARSPGGLPIAIKVIHPHLAGDPEFRSRFRKELNAARAVGGAYTAAVVDADADADQPWLATTFLPGLSLRDTIAAHGPLPVETVRTLGAGLAEALISIHRAGVVHRDLKPSNIIVTPQGPRVIDFGIARAADATAATHTGMAMGSPGYVTPEQVTANVASPAGDVFSLGAVLAYAVTGANPFGEGPSHVLVYRVVHERPLLDGVPEGDLRDLIAACLAKEPEARPTPEEVLDRLASGGEVSSPAWLPGAVADDITARIGALPLTKVLPAEKEPVQAGAFAPPADDDPPDEPRTPLRRRLVGVLVVAGVVAALLGVTRPALWPDGEVCADILPQLTQVTARGDTGGRQRNTALTRLAGRAEDPRLERALADAAATEVQKSPDRIAEVWGEMRAACG
ncbi:serine/threonine-protein kinase [Nonomuraea sp. NPDC048916]|uniref:serine/threonine-protein kinase n=1 Tax=Nonomuraea sp. NPDC048916 TaxID=3154232 RepID=UPI0033F82C86